MASPPVEPMIEDAVIEIRDEPLIEDAVIEIIEEPMIQTDRSFLTVTNFEDETLLDQCVEESADQLEVNPKFKLFGRDATMHRSIGFFSDESIGYRFSGQIAKSKKLKPGMSRLLQSVNQKYGAEFNGILINRYEGGGDYISAHSDDERNLDPVGVVAISWGDTRTFRIREKIPGKQGKIVLDLPMTNLAMLHMGGSFQKEFTHEIPPLRSSKGTRVSFTFRRHRE